MWIIPLAVVVGPFALYALYTLFVVLHLVIVARRLERACAPRQLRVEWELFWMIPVDYVDPVVLTITLHRGERRFSYTEFRSSLKLWRFTRVKVEPLALCNHLRGRVAIEPKDDPLLAVYMKPGEIEVHTFGVEAMDARYRLREETTKKNGPDAIALLGSAFADPDVQTHMDAFGGSLAFEYGYLTVKPASRGAPFLDGIEQVARLADALDGAVKGRGPYR
jgi:hypothetical protein